MQKRRSRSRPEAGSGPGQIEWVRAAELVPSHRNARTHSKKQSGRSPTRSRVRLHQPDHRRSAAPHHCRSRPAGSGAASRDDEVPDHLVSHLSEAAVRAYVLADNRLAEKAGWSRELLALELKELTVLLPEIELRRSTSRASSRPRSTRSSSTSGTRQPDPADDVPATVANAVVARHGRPLPPWPPPPPGRRRAPARRAYDRLMRGELARMAVLDPPTTSGSQDMSAAGAASSTASSSALRAR